MDGVMQVTLQLPCPVHGVIRPDEQLKGKSFADFRQPHLWGRIGKDLRVLAGNLQEGVFHSFGVINGSRRDGQMHPRFFARRRPVGDR